MFTFIFLIAIDSCYSSYITGGYIPTLHLSLHAQVLAISGTFAMSCIMLLLVYLYELLLFVAYLAVCVSIVVRYIRNLRGQKRAQYDVA